MANEGVSLLTAGSILNGNISFWRIYDTPPWRLNESNALAHKKRLDRRRKKNVKKKGIHIAGWCLMKKNKIRASNFRVLLFLETGAKGLKQFHFHTSGPDGGGKKVLR